MKLQADVMKMFRNSNVGLEGSYGGCLFIYFYLLSKVKQVACNISLANSTVMGTVVTSLTR